MKNKKLKKKNKQFKKKLKARVMTNKELKAENKKLKAENKKRKAYAKYLEKSLDKSELVTEKIEDIKTTIGDKEFEFDNKKTKEINDLFIMQINYEKNILNRGDNITQYSILLEMELTERKLTILNSEAVNEAIRILKIDHQELNTKTKKTKKPKSFEYKYDMISGISIFVVSIAAIALMIFGLNLFAALLCLIVFLIYSSKIILGVKNKFNNFGVIAWAINSFIQFVVYFM